MTSRMIVILSPLVNGSVLRRDKAWRNEESNRMF